MMLMQRLKTLNSGTIPTILKSTQVEFILMRFFNLGHALQKRQLQMRKKLIDHWTVLLGKNGWCFLPPQRPKLKMRQQPQPSCKGGFVPVTSFVDSILIGHSNKTHFCCQKKQKVKLGRRAPLEAASCWTLVIFWLFHNRSTQEAITLVGAIEGTMRQSLANKWRTGPGHFHGKKATKRFTKKHLSKIRTIIDPGTWKELSASKQDEAHLP